MDIIPNSSIRTEQTVATAFNEAYNLLNVDPKQNLLLVDENTQTDVLDSIERSQSSWLSKIAKFIRPNRVLEHEVEIVRLGKELALGREAASFDAVTGIYSRRFFDTYLGKEFYRMARESDTNEENVPGIAMLTLDLDNFKAVNDNHGHKIGDKVLRIVAESLQIRMDDVVSRIGGDEFALLMHTSKFDELKQLFFGNNEFSGAEQNTLLRKINELIYKGLQENFENPDLIWQPVVFNGVRTYFSAGIEFQGLNELRGVSGKMVNINSKRERLEYLSDQACMQAKKSRKVERDKD